MSQRDVARGTLEMLILKTLVLEPMCSIPFVYASPYLVGWQVASTTLYKKHDPFSKDRPHGSAQRLREEFENRNLDDTDLVCQAINL